MKQILITFVCIMMAVICQAQDILVTNDGATIKAYNLEIGPSTIFYQLSNDANAETKRIAKGNVLIIRKADGTKIDPNADAPSSATKPEDANNPDIRTSYPKHAPITAIATTPISIDKKGKKNFSAQTPDGNVLNYQILSETEKTVAVTKGKYSEDIYVIPEFAIAGDNTYTITEIAEKVFFGTKIIKITFPSTLKKINERAFWGFKNLEAIILPDQLEEIGEEAFACLYRDRPTIKELYVPKNVHTIGKNCFWLCSKPLSPNGYFMGLITCLPDFITEQNCSIFGIDNSAVRAYKKALKK